MGIASLYKIISPINLVLKQYSIIVTTMHPYSSRPPTSSSPPQDNYSQRPSLNHTPSKKSKYDSFTPRKRYIKEQDEYDHYRNLQAPPPEYSHVQAASLPDGAGFVGTRGRNSSLRRKEPVESSEGNKYRFDDACVPNFEKMYPTESRPPLNQYAVNFNCTTSSRQAKFKNYLESKDLCRKILFDDGQNKDRSNIAQSRLRKDHIQSKQRFLDIDSDPCLTPRRLNKKKEENPGQINQKLSLIQAKIARLERMTPKRTSTPKNSQVVQAPLPQFYHSLSLKEDPKPQPPVSSRVSVVSQRENEIMSRVSLGRLVQEEQCETEIQVIHDLSYKISSKLRSIIRNFG